MPKIWTKQEITTALENRPREFSEKDVLRRIIANGDSIEGLNYTPPVSVVPQAETPTEDKQGFWSTALDYATAPGDVMSGLVTRGIGEVAGALGAEGMQETGRKVFERDVSPENLQQTADISRVAIPVAAGIATGGASIPLSAAISGGAGAGASVLASGLEAAAGQEQTLGGAATEAVTTGLADAAIDAATMGLFRIAKPFIKAKGVAQLSDEATDAAGRIIQSKDKEIIEAGKKAILSLDTTGVQTYDDLFGKLQSKASALLKQQDELLEAIPGTHKLSSLGKTVKSGTSKASVNYVDEALNGLEELYSNGANVDDLVRIRELRKAAKTGGLTVKQLNDVAREYGKGFKAFSDATGSPLTSVNAKRYETVRKGIKNVSRELMPDTASKEIDTAISGLIDTKKSVERMAGMVRGLSNKIEKRGLLGEVAAKIGGGIDLALGRTPSNFFTSVFVRGNIGSKQLNSIQLQKAMPAAIAKLSQLTKQIDTLPEGEVVGRVTEVLGTLPFFGAKATGQAGVGAVTNIVNE